MIITIQHSSLRQKFPAQAGADYTKIHYQGKPVVGIEWHKSGYLMGAFVKGSTSERSIDDLVADPDVVNLPGMTLIHQLIKESGGASALPEDHPHHSGRAHIGSDMEGSISWEGPVTIQSGPKVA